MEISVALRKESVDRNACIAGRRVGPGLSLSARRAWIEIQGGDWVAVRVEVALRKESVDRNIRGLLCIILAEGRSPQGERG